MTFMAILVKEMRLRMRRERTIWVLVLYVLLLGLLAWFRLNRDYTPTISINQWSNVGSDLYRFLILVQLLLTLFITPAFTATAINGEKERKTYEMLICSRISSFSLVTGKLFAGLSNSLLLIAASVPLFSLIFLLGGITPWTVLQDLVTFVITAVLVATLGFLCSTIFPRPAHSTVVAYTLVVLWLLMPVIYNQDLAPSTNTGVYSTVMAKPPRLWKTTSTYTASSGIDIQIVSGQVSGIISSGPGGVTPSLPLITAWNPLMALNDPLFRSYALPSVVYNNLQQIPLNYKIAGYTFTPQVAYELFSGIAIILFLALSLCLVKPKPTSRLGASFKDRIRSKHPLRRFGSARTPAYTHLQP